MRRQKEKGGRQRAEGEREILIFSTPLELAERFAQDLKGMISGSSASDRSFTIALSGGNTPKLLLPVMAARLKDQVSWKKVHIFWVDERCVPPGDRDSNYGMTKSLLLDTINIPPGNIHRIIGEAPPAEEALRYSEEILDFTNSRGKLPMFDLILLGLGDDGHTASIFPGNNKSFQSEKISESVIHPVSHQRRITITGSVINNAANIVFIVTGATKAGIVSEIVEGKKAADYPASKVLPGNGVLKWYLDKAAADLINQK
jgi:6-phosphogluconolactonase